METITEEYSIKLAGFLLRMIPGSTIKITELSDNHSKFIEAVKQLIDVWGFKFIGFNNDYTAVKKSW